MEKQWKPTAKSGSFAPENTLILPTNPSVGRLSLEASRGFVTGRRAVQRVLFFFFFCAGLFLLCSAQGSFLSCLSLLSVSFLLKARVAWLTRSLFRSAYNPPVFFVPRLCVAFKSTTPQNPTFFDQSYEDSAMSQLLTGMCAFAKSGPFSDPSLLLTPPQSA